MIAFLRALVSPSRPAFVTGVDAPGADSKGSGVVWHLHLWVWAVRSVVSGRCAGVRAAVRKLEGSDVVLLVGYGSMPFLHSYALMSVAYGAVVVIHTRHLVRK